MRQGQRGWGRIIYRRKILGWGMPRDVSLTLFSLFHCLEIFNLLNEEPSFFFFLFRISRIIILQRSILCIGLDPF